MKMFGVEFGEEFENTYSKLVDALVEYFDKRDEAEYNDEEEEEL